MVETQAGLGDRTLYEGLRQGLDEVRQQVQALHLSVLQVQQLPPLLGIRD